MHWLHKLRRFFSSDLHDAPGVSRRRFIAGLGGAAVGTSFLLPDSAWAAAEERARAFGIEPGTLVDAQGRPMQPPTSMGVEPFIAEIIMFAGNFAPRGWAFCDGQLLPISQYQALFSLLGTTYGGNGTTSFALPDLRGRVPLHPGSGVGLSPYTLGQQGGAEQVTLAQTQMPSHNHAASTTVNATETQVRGTGTQVAGPTTGGDRGATDAISASTTVGNAGGSQSHENRPPFLGINFIIALQGIYPSRN